MHELLVEGGGERQCVSLARELSRQGHDVTLYTSAYDRDGCFPQICKSLKIRDVGRGLFPRITRPRVLRGYLDMRALASRVQESHPIWNPHHWPAEWGAVRLKKKLGGAVVWMCNDVPNFYEKAHKPGSPRGILGRLLYRLDYLYDRAQTRKIDLILFLSRWAEGEFKAIYPARSQVVRSGADPDRFKPGGDGQKIRSRFGYADNDFVVLWLGIIMPHRRLQDAIEAVAKLKQKGVTVRLLLAGSGETFPDYFASLKSTTRELGLEDRVTFAGKVPDEAMRDFYCACDVFLFPNEKQTWGLAVLEAMSCGRPVLVSRGAAVHEVLTDGESAVLFPPRDTDALAQCMERLVSIPDYRARIAQAGMQLVRSQFNWEQFARQVTKACGDLTAPGVQEIEASPVTTRSG
jgi:glycosyltransferase involved in cell wall biosynthesis